MKKMRMCFPKEKTFEDGFREYILDCKARNLRDGTIHHYEESIKQIYKRIPPHTPISSLNKQTMTDFYIALRDDPNRYNVFYLRYHISTSQKYAELAVCFLQYAFRCDIILYKEGRKMKRSISILSVILVVCLAFPLTTYAKTYTMSDTDISISVDDSSWYVFTRDNLQNNSELEELGIESDAMRDILANNMAYMDAIVFYEDGDYVEFFIRKAKIENSFTNLSNYSYEQVLELAEAFGERQNTKNYSVYENQYKFVRLEYFDSTCDYYICEYITIVNKDNYTLTFQSPSSFTDWELDEIQNIVDSIKFDVDSSLEELIPTASVEQNTPSVLEQAVETGITGAISGGLLAIMALLFRKIKKASKTKKKNNVPESNESPEAESTNQAMPEKLECQQKTRNEDKTNYPQESASLKDVAGDKGFEDIKKYKDLLDLGIITQEEFDTKKKELLDL